MSKISAPQAHQIADQAHQLAEHAFTDFISATHARIKTTAERGNYSLSVSVPSQYQSKIFRLVTYFSTFGYRVSVSGREVTIVW